MSRILVVDTQRRPLHPCTPARARLLLKQGKAAVLRRYPFILILKVAHAEAENAPLRLKIDPGSKTTGLAVVNDSSGDVIWATELTHRGEAVHKALVKRRAARRSRRSRHTRYRKPRFANRRSPRGGCPHRWSVAVRMCSPGWPVCGRGVPLLPSLWSWSHSTRP